MTKKFKKKPQLHRVVAIRRLERNQRKVRGRAIDRIKVQDTDGNLEVWTTGKAINAMLAGTDAFFVVGVIPWAGEDPTSMRIVWSQVTPWPYENPKTIRTVTDKKRPDDLMNLPRF